MSSKWTMRDRITGEVKSGESVADTEFIWTDGNWGCDHNRVTEFYGYDSPENDDANVACNMMPDHTPRFILLRLECPEGVFEWPDGMPEMNP